MAEKVTIMKLKVDLQCEKCYRKVKKVLCKFLQIRDQMYDEKHNVVTIKVVCCSPEKLRDKLCYQGGGSIKSIEIVEPPKPEPPAPEKPPKEPEKPKQPVPKAEPEPAAPEKPPKEPEKPTQPVPKAEPDPQDRVAPPAPPREPKPQDRVAPPTPPPSRRAAKFSELAPVSVLAYPSPAVPIGLFYEGGPGGPPGFYGRPIYDSYGGGGPCYMGHHHQEPLCEEAASVCTIN